jgi:hypothetical protein
VRKIIIVWLNGVWFVDPNTKEGIQDLEVKNRDLVSKWLNKLLTEDGV